MVPSVEELKASNKKEDEKKKEEGKQNEKVKK